MSEVLAWDGGWTVELLELMMPVAIELEAERMETQYSATAAAVASLFDKKPAQEFHKMIGKVKRGARQAQMRSRDIPDLEKSIKRSQAANQMLEVFKRMGLKQSGKGKR